MRDLIRNYRMIIKGKPESDTDESQPLMSSSCSSTGSFGAIKQPAIFQQDFDSSDCDCKEDNRTTTPSSGSVNTSCHSLSFERQLERRMYCPSNFDTPRLDIFTKNQTTYDSYDNYSKMSGDLENQPILGKRKTTLNGSYNDYSEIESSPTHNSMVTIFAVWNTTMGSSLLAISWGLQKSGLFPGIFINLLVAAIALYTAYTILKVNEKHGMIGQTNEVSDLCKLLIGRWAEVLAKIFSLVVLIGANIVYWILMSNFLYNSVLFLYGYLIAEHPDRLGANVSSVICPQEMLMNNSQNNSTETENELSTFDRVWDLYSTVPVFLALIMFPLLNFKSATFFAKFNSLGTLSVLYLIIFAVVKAYRWGLHIPNWSLEFDLKSTFCALSGMLSLSYFIHNIIISIMKNNKHQENNGRDLTIAFGLVTFTYLIIGVLLYITFPLAKSCIEDNILNNFDKYDTATIVARLLLLFQLFTVFPLMCYMLRNDIFGNINIIFKNYRFGDFSYGRVILLNLVILTICILFACFLPRIGTLIRYTGALSGLVYIFMLPSLLKIASLKKEGSLSVPKLLFHIFVIILGFLNLLSQFLIND